MNPIPDESDRAPLTAEDRAFLRALSEIPEDQTTWLVYADWLEDRGDPRAEFLRLTVARSNLAATDPALAAVEARLAQLRVDLNVRWLAAFDPAPIVTGCGRTAYPGRCSQSWTELAATDAPDIRICRECRRPVFYGHTAEEAEQIGSTGEAVALSTRVPAEQNPFPLPPPDLDELEVDVNDLDAYFPDVAPAAPAPEPQTRPWWRLW